MEVLFADAQDDEAVSGEEGKGGVRGEMMVRGPGVAGQKGSDGDGGGKEEGEVRLGIRGKVRGDGCLAVV